MKKILLNTITGLVLFSSCSTRPIKIVSPPEIERLEVLKNAIETDNVGPVTHGASEELAKDYLLALRAEKKGQTKDACDLFDSLSNNQDLAIKDAALVHAIKDCDYSAKKLEKIWSKTEFAGYLKEALYEISVVEASKKNLPSFEAQFSYELTFIRPVQADKLKLIRRAIALAEQLKDEEKIKRYNDRLKEISPLHITDINEQNIYKIAKDFEANRKFDRARELYKQIINGDYSIDEKVRALTAYKTSYKIERDLKTFLLKSYEMEAFLRKEMEKGPDDKKTIEHWVDAKIALIKAIWTDHRNHEARKLLQELINTKLGNSNQRASMQMIFGSLHLELKENNEALKRYERALGFKISDSSLLENIQWAIVWNHYLLKNNQSVVRFADQFIKNSSNPFFISRLKYWKAKGLLRMSSNDEAEEVLNDLIKSEPFGYYGLLASMELGHSLSPIPPSIINNKQTGIMVLDWLIAVEEKGLSQKFLKEIDSQFKTSEERERAMSLYSQTEWYQGAMRQIYNFKMSTRNSMTEKYINVVFPTPYLPVVNRLSEKYQVPKELIYAITRQESAFVATERSWADAFGLMQMIPEKAKELSKKYQIPYKDINDLYVPEINLEMGTALLKDLRDNYHSQFIQTVAAYNASEAVISVWERERFNGNYIEFVEMIPYEETRNYIKTVFRNFMIYKRITSKEDLKIEKDFFARPF